MFAAANRRDTISSGYLTQVDTPFVGFVDSQCPNEAISDYSEFALQTPHGVAAGEAGLRPRAEIATAQP